MANAALAFARGSNPGLTAISLVKQAEAVPFFCPLQRAFGDEHGV
jgi:hypothetical protein